MPSGIRDRGGGESYPCYRPLSPRDEDFGWDVDNSYGLPTKSFTIHVFPSFGIPVMADLVVTIVLVALKNIFIFDFGSPSHGGPGEGPDCHSLREIKGFGPILARIPGLIIFLILILALSAAWMSPNRIKL